MRRKIRITESQLRRTVNEAVRNLLMENDRNIFMRRKGLSSPSDIKFLNDDPNDISFDSMDKDFPYDDLEKYMNDEDLISKFANGHTASDEAEYAEKLLDIAQRNDGEGIIEALYTYITADDDSDIKDLIHYDLYAELGFDVEDMDLDEKEENGLYSLVYDSLVYLAVMLNNAHEFEE